MKINKLLFLCLIFVNQLVFSQSGKIIHGKISCESNLIQGIEIINLVSEKSAFSDQNGMFSILVKVDDILVFGSKVYDFKRKLISNDDIKNDNLSIELVRKTEQLDEVIVLTKKSDMRLPNIQAILDKQYFDDAQSSPKTTNVYNGQTLNGINFVRIFTGIAKLLKKKHPEKKDFKPEMNFVSTALKRNNHDFFTKTLKLKETEISTFLAFCENDPRANLLLEPENVFGLMEFLIQKNKEFQTIPTFDK